MPAKPDPFALSRPRPSDRGTAGAPLALTLAALLVAGCANDREAQCREQGLVPGTAEFLACKNPEKAEDLKRAKAAWNRVEHKDHR